MLGVALALGALGRRKTEVGFETRALDAAPEQYSPYSHIYSYIDMRKATCRHQLASADLFKLNASMFV